MYSEFSCCPGGGGPNFGIFLPIISTVGIEQYTITSL